jgi:CheY-like chemotaxis protein
MPLHKALVDLAEVVETSVAAVRPLLEEKGLALEVSVPDNMPSIYCDRVRIRQVILNLLSNAARFTERGGIALQVVQRDPLMVLSVADTGPGIPPEDAERIFEPFAQASAGGLSGKGGSGLGLSISKQFVELHGGRIWVESRPGVGTTFFVELPLGDLAAPAARPARWISEEWAWRQPRARPELPEAQYKPRVVICDSTGDLLPAFARRADEAEFVSRQHLSDALSELARCPAQALVINATDFDELWPMVDHARRQAADTLVIGCAFPARLTHPVGEGAADYVIKPLTRETLVAAMDRLGRSVRRVLVVDDDDDALELITLYLRSHDPRLEVLTARSGEEALVVLRQDEPDLMLLDVIMPGMDGWGALAAKRDDERIRDIPTILVSAQDVLDVPLRSQALLVTVEEGFSTDNALDCAAILSRLLFQPG